MQTKDKFKYELSIEVICFKLLKIFQFNEIYNEVKEVENDVAEYESAMLNKIDLMYVVTKLASFPTVNYLISHVKF